MKRIKGKLEISMDTGKHIIVPINVFVLNNCPYGIFGQDFLHYFDINIDNRRSIVRLIKNDTQVQCKLLVLTNQAIYSNDDIEEMNPNKNISN